MPTGRYRIKEHLRTKVRSSFNSYCNRRQDHAGNEIELVRGGESELLPVLVHHVRKPLKRGADSTSQSNLLQAEISWLIVYRVVLDLAADFRQTTTHKVPVTKQTRFSKHKVPRSCLRFHSASSIA